MIHARRLGCAVPKNQTLIRLLANGGRYKFFDVQLKSYSLDFQKMSQ